MSVDVLVGVVDLPVVVDCGCFGSIVWSGLISLLIFYVISEVVEVCSYDDTLSAINLCKKCVYMFQVVVFVFISVLE